MLKLNKRENNAEEKDRVTGKSVRVTEMEDRKRDRNRGMLFRKLSSCD